MKSIHFITLTRDLLFCLHSVSAEEQLFKLYEQWMALAFHMFYFVYECFILDSIFPSLLLAS